MPLQRSPCTPSLAMADQHTATPEPQHVNIGLLFHSFSACFAVGIPLTYRTPTPMLAAAAPPAIIFTLCVPGMLQSIRQAPILQLPLKQDFHIPPVRVMAVTSHTVLQQVGQVLLQSPSPGMCLIPGQPNRVYVSYTFLTWCWHQLPLHAVAVLPHAT